MTTKEKQKKVLDTFGLKVGDIVTLGCGTTEYRITADKFEYFLYNKNHCYDFSMLITTVWKKVTPLLDDVEKKYLSQVIRPFRKKIENIKKARICATSDEYILIYLKNNDYATLPYFKKGTMYKGMDANKFYTLEELGI